MTGTLMAESDHPMVRMAARHLASLEALRAGYAELRRAMVPLQDEAERTFSSIDAGDEEVLGDPPRHEMPPYKTTDFLTARRAYENAVLAELLLPRSLLVAMVSQHDAFIDDLIRALLSARPDLVVDTKRSVTWNELRAFDGLEELQQSMLDAALGEVMRSSHRAQLEWISRLLDLKLDSDPQLLARFAEVVQRRHLYAHTAGAMNAKYLAARRAVDPSFAGSKGEILRLSPGEFEHSYVTLAELSIKLWQVTWRKAVPSELELAEEALYRLGYELLVFERWDLAASVLRFALDMPRHCHEHVRRKNMINLAQAYKWQGDGAACARTIAGDWSAYEDSFGLAIAVLKDEFAEAERLMCRVGRRGDIERRAFDDWPLFRAFRKTEHFERAYTQLFGAGPSERAA